MEDTIPFQRLANIRHYAAAYAQLGNDYIFSRLTKSSRDLILSKQPLRVSGIAFCLLLTGSLTLEINSKEYHLEPLSLFTFGSHLVIKITKADWDNIDAYMLFLSTQFIKDININLNTVDFSILGIEPSPVLDHLKPEELNQLMGYLELLNQNANVNIENIYSKNAARSLLQALFYQLMQIKYNHTQLPTDASDPAASRRMTYVQEFLQLVQTHHFRERSLNFYAEKMFISPKYLSRIIKETTGRSAAEWIDQFVVHEAKNMLRFSNKNIQQVAYSLNFSTQSSFGKFFKHMTGQSPSDYQKT